MEPYQNPSPAPSSLGNVRDGSGATPELSIVIPLYNEADNLEALAERLQEVMAKLAVSYEVIFVDDGSSDGSLDKARLLNQHDRRFQTLSFSRNFGKEIAIAAGLDVAKGQAVVIMDADLQHPPEVIEEFLTLWRQGYQNIYAQRRDRDSESRLRRWFAKHFYRLFGVFGEIELPPGAGDFRLLDGQAAAALRAMGERARFSKGLYAWVGFKSIGVPFDVAERASGTSKFSYRKLTRFALDGLMSFSSAPLRVWTYVGSIIATFALSMAIYFIIHTATRGVDVPGYASLIVSVMFFAGVQLMSLGILGEYIGRIFAEVKRRPLYLIAERIGFTAENADDTPLPPLKSRR